MLMFKNLLLACTVIEKETILEGQIQTWTRDRETQYREGDMTRRDTHVYARALTRTLTHTHTHTRTHTDMKAAQRQGDRKTAR